VSAAVVVALIVGALAGGTVGLVIGIGLASARLPQTRQDRLRHSSAMDHKDTVALQRADGEQQTPTIPTAREAR